MNRFTVQRKTKNDMVNPKINPIAILMGGCIDSPKRAAIASSHPRVRIGLGLDKRIQRESPILYLDHDSSWIS